VSTALRLGTRRSPLAVAQSRLVATALEAAGADPVEMVEISTLGDVSREPLAELGGTGVFVSALRDALLAREIDLAVHSLKDLPVLPEPGLLVAAITRRADPRDALVARDGLTLGELPAGSVVGTGSPRRAAQLTALGLGLDVRAIRGNVDTRIGLVAAGKCDAVVLAAAGLFRLGRLGEATELLDPLQMLPAPGQGALAVECRDSDTAMAEATRPLDDADTRASVTAERALLAALEAGCTAPVGALAEVVEGEAGPELSIRAFVGAEDGSAELRRSITGQVDDAERLGRELARILLDDGARDMVAIGLGPAVSEDRPPDPAKAGGPDMPSAGRRPEDPASRPDPTAPERAS
jgi:hydroxymethylbilane synthase